jgi:hypothetical protein
MKRMLGAVTAACVLWVASAVLLWWADASAQGVPPGAGSGGGSSTPQLTAGDVVSMVADAGTLARADQDLYVNAIHLQGKAPDGGSAVQVLSVNQPIATFKMSSGSQAEVQVTGNTAFYNFSTNRLGGTVEYSAQACAANTNCYTSSSTGYWPRDFPTTDTSGCVGVPNAEGGRKWHTTLKRGVRCTSAEVIVDAVKGGPWSAALDFPAFANSTCEVLSFTATGAVLDEPVVPGGCGTVVGTDKDLRCNAVVSTSNQVSIQICCEDSAGCADLPSLTFSASALR